MTELLTPEQVAVFATMADMREAEGGVSVSVPVTALRALLRDREAICERLESAAIHHEAKAKLWRTNNDIQRSRHHRECAEELREILSELRGGK